MARNSKLEYQALEYNGVRLTVCFTVSGKYYPATHYEPAEYPELDIMEVTAYDSDVNLMDAFGDDKIDEIAEILKDKIEY